jgi:isopenicillin N synthase-like dioxygenase
MKADPNGIFDALRERGYCWVLNSGFTDKEVLDLCLKSQDFWRLPKEQKDVYKQGKEITFSGYVPWGVHRPTANTPKHLLTETLFDFKEAFDFMHKDNNYCVIPDYDESRDFFEQGNQFLVKASLIGKQIVDIVSDNMNERGKDGERGRQCFEQLGEAENMSYLRIAYYPSNKERSKATNIQFGSSNVNRIGIHRDSAPYVAIILSPSIDGLEIEDPEFGWFAVSDMGLKDAMWIHMGQLGYHLTDGFMQMPPLHKVVLPSEPEASDRYCIVHFLGADHHAVIPPMTADPPGSHTFNGFEWVRKALVKGYAPPIDPITNEPIQENGVAHQQQKEAVEPAK